MWWWAPAIWWDPKGLSACLRTEATRWNSYESGRPLISHLIVDGYNLIGVHHKDLRKQRDMLIDSLIEYRKSRGHDITVVFDGWRTGPGAEARSVVGGVRVIYSGVGDKADDVIKRILSSERKEWIVVSSDRDIADHAWRCGSVPITSERFLMLLTRERTLQEDEDEDEEEEYALPRRGSPRQLSKKEKAIRRALSKL